MTAVPTTQDPMAPPTNQHLRAAVQIVREARARLETAKTFINVITQVFEGNYEGEFVELGQAKAAADTAEAHLRIQAEAHYRWTGEKKPAPGVEIKVMTEVTITDPKAALEYAKQTGLCIQLDEKGYKALAKTNDVPGATVAEVPKASIAKDLTAAVREEVR